MDIPIERITGFTSEYVTGFKKITGQDSIQLYYRDIRQLAEHLFSHPLLHDYMITNPWIATRNGERVYNDLSTSNWWLNLQKEVGEETVILALMFSSDMTLVSTNARKKAWPLYLTLGNIPTVDLSVTRRTISHIEFWLFCRL